MKREWREVLVWWTATLAVAWVGLSKIRDAWTTATQTSQASASDALPLYLGAKAIRVGLDPTHAENLQRLYEGGDMHVTKALFSVLYPPSMHVMLQPLANLSYGGFLHYWRPLLLVGLIVGAAVGGTVGVRGQRVGLAMAVSVLGTFSLFPLFVDVQLGLGQPNLLIVGLFGLAMGCAARGWMSGVGLAAVIGAGMKLVPVVIVWPMLWARRWRAVTITAVFGLVLAAITIAYVPLDRVLDNLAATWAFQNTVEPHWLHDGQLPTWGRFIGFLRRPSLALLSLVLIAWTVWVNRGDARVQGEASAVGIGLLATALAADSCGVGAYYATMAIPGMTVILCWPLAQGASRISWLAWPAVFAIVALTDGGLIYNTPNVEVKLVLACTVMWSAVALRLATLARPWGRWALAVAAGLVALALIHASIWTWRPPYGGPKTLPSASPGSMTTPNAPPMAPVPHDR